MDTMGVPSSLISEFVHSSPPKNGWSATSPITFKTSCSSSATSCWKLNSEALTAA
ncbi:hypothetical protein HanXRQr2_Chr06g0263161 [Helianthus annuus]|nr:hypothetical protein HanXRQr2_Chr06g0263161 [Helianthus annuus]KAJ0915779.1 hypothetical protein HanPSC8_Chr06g0253821 [Helianthus annuus]